MESAQSANMAAIQFGKKAYWRSVALNAAGGFLYGPCARRRSSERYTPYELGDLGSPYRSRLESKLTASEKKEINSLIRRNPYHS